MGLSFPICPAQLSHPCFCALQSGRRTGPLLKALVNLDGGVTSAIPEPEMSGSGAQSQDDRLDWQHMPSSGAQGQSGYVRLLGLT